MLCGVSGGAAADASAVGQALASTRVSRQTDPDLPQVATGQRQELIRRRNALRHGWHRKRRQHAPAINSCILAQHLPDAQLITYPGSGHGFLFQYPSLFAAHAARFPGTDATVA